MALSLKRIEKEFILSSARDDKIRILLIAGTGEWPVTITELERERLVLSHAMPLRLLRKGAVHEFRFVYHEQTMAFRAKLLEAKEGSLAVEMPPTVYKNLGRRYSRRAPPAELAVSFSFRGDRYELAFPTTKEYDPVEAPVAASTFDPHDIRALIAQFNDRASEFASERAVRMFKDRKPESLEERIVVRTGKIYYLPTAMGGIPTLDPYPQPRIVTRSMFADYLREQGDTADLADEEIVRFERNKRSMGVFSELIIPLLFQEYVIGYVCLVNKQQGKPPFDLAVLETFLQFAKVLAYSLKINGYFRNAPKKPQDYRADVVDISAGGLLFANSSPDLAASLLPGSSLDLDLRIGERTAKARAGIKRTYRDANRTYYGVEFEEIAPEDFRFLFESLYGRDFTDTDATGIEGLGIKMPMKFD